LVYYDLWSWYSVVFTMCVSCVSVLELSYELAIAVVILCPESPLTDIFIFWSVPLKRMVVVLCPLTLVYKPVMSHPNGIIYLEHTFFGDNSDIQIVYG